MTELYTVRSGKEILTADDSGRVIQSEVITLRLTQITRFDLIEWQRFWRDTTLPQSFDILDLGYWYVLDAEQIAYEPPDFIWRRSHVRTTKNQS